MTVEELEPWILMSADVAPAFDVLSSLASENETHEMLVDSYDQLSSPVVEGVADVVRVRREIVFVDTQVADYEQIVEGLERQSSDQRQIEVFLIDAGEDGVERISDVLGARHDIDAVHIFSHGVDGAVELGGSWLNGVSLQMQSERIAGWRSALSADADLLLYGCNVARDTEGKAFLDRLGELTGADVAASDDATGAADLGGDWNLEVATGSIETSAVLDAGVQRSWAHVMAITVGNSSSAATAGDASSLTWAHTVGGGSDGLLLVTVAIETNSGTSVSSVTYGGVTLTRLGEDTSGRTHVEMWYLKVPAAGMANIVVTLTTANDRFAAGATDFFGVEQDSSAYSSGSVVTADGTGDPSLTIASAAGELVVDGVAGRDTDSEVVGAGQTVLFTDKNGTSPSDAWVGSSYEDGAASVTMSWTTAGPGGDWAAVAVALKPANGILHSYEPPFSGMSDEAYEVKSGQSWGQTFSYNSPTATYSVGEIGLVLYRASDAPAGQTLTVSLRSSWNGAVIASGTIVSDSLGTSEAWVNVTLTGTATLNDNQTYYLRVDSDSSGGKVYLGVDDSGSYTAGNLINNSGVAQSGKDAAFRLIQHNNTAPTLDNTKSPTLTAQNEDSGAPVGAVGTLVSSLVDITSPAGGLDNVTDPDAGALLGIAVTAADTANGTWWYTTNGGTNWNAFGAVSESSARLLAANAGTRLYFQPNVNWNGAANITFRAWDQTSGTNGGAANVTATGGTTAFSTATDTASLTVNAVNDAPTATIIPASYGATEQVDLTLHGSGLSIADVDAGSASVQAALSVGYGVLTASAGGTGVTVAGSGTGVVTLTGTVTQINSLLAGVSGGTLRYAAGTDAPPASTVLTLTASDLGNTGSGGTLTGFDTATINITAVNDAPTTTPVTLAPIAEDSGPRLITQAELLANASDPDADPLTASALAISAGGGTLVDNGNGTWSYTPAANDNSGVTFSYTIGDGNGGSVAGSATLDITPVNDAPTTTPITLAPIAEDSGPRLITQAELLANAADPDGDALTASGLAISSGGGTLVNNGNGTWSYTPASNDSSGVSFSYTIADGNGGSIGGTASLDITPVNDAPTTTPVTLAPIAEDSGPRLITQAELLANATDVDGDLLTASALAISAGGGTLVDNGNGTWSYTPAANDSSGVGFSYTISDGNGGSVGGTASLDITPVNDAPTTTPVTLAPIAEDSGGRLITQAELLANASDVESDPLTASGLSIVSGGGTLVDNGNGTWSYTPAPNDNSTVSFSYAIGDGNGGSVAGSATLDITPVNDTPTTTPATLAPIAEDSGPRLITQAELLANAADPDGDALTASGLAISSGSGTLVDNGNGTWSYTPAAGDSSGVSFSYTIGDGNGGSVAGSATLDITPANDAPTTTPVTLAPIAEDSGPRLITQAELLANAADPDGDALTASGLAISSGSGTLVDNGNGTWSYTPAANDSSGVGFSYTISDGNGGSIGGTASLDITPVNDAPTTTPVTLAPIAEDSGPRLITQAELLANAADPDGDALTASGLAISSGSGTLVDNGNGTWSYTPAANDSSGVTFGYTIGDGNGGSVAGSATLDITPANDAPTATPVTLAPIAEDSGPRLITQAELLANAADPDGDALTASGLAISSGSGTLVDNGNGTWSYTPAGNDSSGVSFSYTIDDANGGSVAGSASLDITPANDAPTTTPVTLAPIGEDSGPRLITQAELLANATDVDGDPLTASGLAISAGGGMLVDNGNGTWSYTPASNDSSGVSFSYTIDDGNGGSVAGSASLDITPVNNAPTTTPVTLAPIAEDSGPRLITQAHLLANATDVDGDPLTASGLSIASGGGTLVDNGNGTWSYTPAANDSSGVTFGYTIGDSNGGSVAGNATLDITPANDAPTTTPVTLAPIAEDSGPRLITQAELLANAADPDGDALTASGLAISAGGGTLVDNGNGTWSYTPAADDDSNASFSYMIGDGNGGLIAGSASLDLTTVNDAPLVTSNGGGPNAAISSTENTSAVTVVTSADVEGDAVQYSIAGGADASRFQIDPVTGALVFSSPPNYEAPADSDGDNVYEVIARVADSQGGIATQTLQIAIAGVDEAPRGGGDLLETADNQQLILAITSLLANDLDEDGDALQIVSFSAPAYGTLAQDASGAWIYTPQPGFVGTDTFTYTVMAAGGGSATAQVDIIVTAFATGPADATPSPLAQSQPAPQLESARQPEPTEKRDSEAVSPPPGGGGPVDGSSERLPDAILDSDLAGTAEPPANGRDGAVERLVDEMERQRVYDARPWTPPGQAELKLAIDQLVADMSGRLIALERSGSTEEVSRSLAVFDETFTELLDGVRQVDRQVGQVTVGSSIALSAGIVAWLLRGGALAASLFSALPAWMSFDPVPILVGRRDSLAPTAPRPSDDSNEAAVARVLRPGTRHQPSDQG